MWNQFGQPDALTAQLQQGNDLNRLLGGFQHMSLAKRPLLDEVKEQRAAAQVKIAEATQKIMDLDELQGLLEDHPHIARVVLLGQKLGLL